MKSIFAGLASILLASAAPAQVPAAAPPAAAVELWRLDCGSILFKDFNAFFSDTLEYPAGPRELTDSCYLVRHGDQYLLWDSGFPAAMKSGPRDMGAMTASMKATIADQLAQLRLKPADVDVVGISHMHADHTGQAALFPGTRLVVGAEDFKRTAGKDDPFGPWRGEGKPVTLASADVDIFGDGSVIALNMPGHTPNHLALLVKLESGPVLLSGDIYHAHVAREKKGVPPFNTSRAETLASMDRYERLATQLGARVIIQHEPADIAKLPAFPQSAR